MVHCSTCSELAITMTDTDCERAQKEIDELLNDPETPISPDRIWALAEAIAAAGCDAGD
jgi:hypothetical protein